MGASAKVLQQTGVFEPAAHEKSRLQSGVIRETRAWDPEGFAREQIRGLVRRLFLAGGDRPVRQVVFSAAEPQIDVGRICDRVGQALALETGSDIAVVSRTDAGNIPRFHPRYSGRPAIKVWSTRIAINLWRVPEFRLLEHSKDSGTKPSWLSCLAHLKDEFEYALIQGPSVGMSNEAALLGHLTDGIILVLGAHSTRRATACKIKETLQGTHSRILGTVLSERRFPVPERIYRRL